MLLGHEACCMGNESSNSSEPEIVEEDSEEEINEMLPEGVHYDSSTGTLNIKGNEFDVDKKLTIIKSRAKDKGPATVALTMGGVTAGLLISGPFLGVGAATSAGLIGALYDKGYIEFTEEGRIELNIHDDSEVEEFDPFEKYDSHWYEPESDEYEYAVRLPNEDLRYFKTQNGAAERIIKEYHSD